MSNEQNRRSHAPNEMMLRRTLVLMMVCGILAFAVLILQLFRLQVIDHEKYESMAIEQQVRETTVSASRGTIYDRNGTVLAASADVYTVFLSPAEIAKNKNNPNETPEFIAEHLSKILNMDYNKLLEMAKDTKSWYKTVARKVDDETAEAVRQFKADYKLVGVKLETDTKRFYPFGSLAAHVIGFVGLENTGLSGIEAYYDDALSGEDGRVTRATTGMGTRMLYTNFEDYYDAVDGNDVVLTIDETIQYYVEKHLQQAVEDYDIQNGAAAIAVDVNTMEVLALASLGSFDLNDYQTVSPEAQAEIDAAATKEEKSRLLAAAQQAQWRCKAISDTYEPGSTFKILTLAMALEEGVTSLDDSFGCGGSIRVAGDSQPRKCWKTQGHGMQTLTQATQHSCNVAFINLGLRVGAEKFYQYCEGFGLLNLPTDSSHTPTGKTGIDLSGESGSIWWSPDVFYKEGSLTQLAAASFGQTFTITPIQLITAVSACVNGGYMRQPYLVKQILDENGTVIEERQPEVLRQVISEETSAKVRQILEQVVGDSKEGTGRNAYVSGYRIGGKTGTSENVVMIAQTGQKEYIVSIIGFAPANDPQIAILVLLDSPSNKSGVYISGGQMGAPTVGNMFRDILPYLGVEPAYTEEEQEKMDKTVPSLVGMTLSEAQKKLAETGLTCRTIGSGGTVTNQLPHQGSVIQQGSQVILYTGATPSEKLENMPDVTGYTYSDAAWILSSYGLFIRTDSSVTDPKSQVVATQSIPVGTAVEHGTVMQVTLVSGDSGMLGRY
ncbi:MAG: PASTA domain-containing protein [Oscillospiraceae bacterium]|nr:PASTA domain-containing protein [Oscillospiraceae bacterium]